MPIEKTRGDHTTFQEDGVESEREEEVQESLPCQCGHIQPVRPTTEAIRLGFWKQQWKAGELGFLWLR